MTLQSSRPANPSVFINRLFTVFWMITSLSLLAPYRDNYTTLIFYILLTVTFLLYVMITNTILTIIDLFISEHPKGETS